MNPTLNGSSVIRCFKGSNAIKIRNGRTFDLLHGTAKYILLPTLVIMFISCWVSGDVCSSEGDSH